MEIFSFLFTIRNLEFILAFLSFYDVIFMGTLLEKSHFRLS